MRNLLKSVFIVLCCLAAALACANELKKADTLYDQGQIKEALEIYLKPENSSNPRVQNRIGMIYRKDGFTDEKKALEWYSKAAQQGYSYAQYNLGIAYLEAKGIKQDYARAIALFQQAAAKGRAGAMNAIGTMHQEGLGVEKDECQAAKWYTKAAAKGSTDALCNASGLLMHSKEIKHNYEKAHTYLRWCIRDDPKNVCCLNRMAELYFDGWGVERDRKKAMELREKAAIVGSVVAMYNLGTVYDYGLGVKKNSRAAMDWYLKAAEKGESMAMYRLYEAYEYGKLGQTMDKTQAAQWKAKAETAMKEEGLSRNELMDSFRLLMEVDEN